VVVARCCHEPNLQGCIVVIPTNKHREASVAVVMMVHPASALAVVSIAPFMYLWLMIIQKCGSCSDVVLLLRGVGIKARKPNVVYAARVFTGQGDSFFVFDLFQWLPREARRLTNRHHGLTRSGTRRVSATIVIVMDRTASPNTTGIQEIQLETKLAFLAVFELKKPQLIHLLLLAGQFIHQPETAVIRLLEVVLPGPFLNLRTTLPRTRRNLRQLIRALATMVEVLEVLLSPIMDLHNTHLDRTLCSLPQAMLPPTTILLRQTGKTVPRG
jgi:hypothetical protein